MTSPLRLVVEIGFGRGEFLLDLASRSPEVAHLGVEYSAKRVLKLARRLARTPLCNVRLIEARAERVVEVGLLEGTVEAFWINFPDPWPKRRHYHRRLLQPAFVQALACRLVPGGLLQGATDHPHYAEQIAGVLAGEPQLENCYAPEAFRMDVEGRLPTAYEREWRAAGRKLYFWSYCRRES